jgi:hypothetical protein
LAAGLLCHAKEKEESFGLVFETINQQRKEIKNPYRKRLPASERPLEPTLLK